MAVTDAQFHAGVYSLLIDVAGGEETAMPGLVNRIRRFTLRAGTIEARADRREIALRLLKDLALASGVDDDPHARLHWLRRMGVPRGSLAVEIP